MIQHLKIENLALLEGAELEFEEGYTCVTGETGAGKSILLGALGLLSGARTDKAMIRQGAETCAVEAGLALDGDACGEVDAFLESRGLPACEEGTLLLRRTFSRKRIPQIQVNGAGTTLAVLRELGERWIDFHGPGEPQKLFREAVQLEMLDAYARGSAPSGRREGIFEEYGRNFKRWREVCERMEMLRGESRLSEDEQAYIREQLAKMDRLPLEEEAIRDLERDYQRYSSSQELRELTGALMEGLSGEGGIGDRLAEMVRGGQGLSALDEEGAGLLERLQSLVIEVDDLSASFRDLAESTEFDPEALEALESRMHTWMELKRRYGNSFEAVVAERKAMEDKLALQGDLAGSLGQLQEEADSLQESLREGAAKILEIRETAGKALAEAVVTLMNQLGFKNARFRIDVKETAKLTRSGGSECFFLFAPNSGQAMQPLNKIASSGETARVMLALKTILASMDRTPVLIFDEVDANIGGEIGQEVGKLMRRLGESHQVLCVTHLPQVASHAHCHFVVDKVQGEETTHVDIHPLHGAGEERIREIARMLGDRKSASAREHAVELLGRSEAEAGGGA